MSKCKEKNKRIAIASNVMQELSIFGDSYNFTVGKIYDVIAENDDQVVLINDEGDFEVIGKIYFVIRNA